MLLRPGLIRGPRGGGLGFAAVNGGALGAGFTTTRAQTNSGLSSAINAGETDYDFYAANIPRFTRSLRGLIVEGARTNLVLNSAVGATQNITVAATAHTISFEGTGSVTWSGTAAGSLNGTGSGIANRVSSSFTPTAGTLTLTIAGSVTRLQLEAAAFASTYIETGSSSSQRNAETVSATAAAQGLGSTGIFTALLRIRTSLLATNRSWFAHSDGTINNRIVLRNTTGVRTITILRTTGGAGASSATVGTYTDNVAFNLGLTSLGNGNCSASFDGAAAVDHTGAPTSGYTITQLLQAGGGNEFAFNTELIKCNILPYGVSNAELAILTGTY